MRPVILKGVRPVILKGVRPVILKGVRPVILKAEGLKDLRPRAEILRASRSG